MMSKLPDSWVLAPLGSLLSAIVGGGTPSKTNPQHFSGTIPFMTVKDMHGRFLEDTQDHITDEALAGSASTLVPADTLIVASRMSLGKIARPRVPVAINQDLKALFLHAGIDKTYVEHLWRANQEKIREKGTGTTVKGIRLEDIRDLDVPVAPSAEQTRIADQIDSLLARVNACNDHLDAIPGILKRFRQAVLDAAMTGTLTNCARPHLVKEFTPAQVQEVRLQAEAKKLKKNVEEFVLNHPPMPAGDEAPAGWLRTHVGLIGIVSNGSTPSRGDATYWGGDIPWVSSGEVANGAITSTRENITAAGYENSSVRLLPVGTVLLAMIGEGKTRGQSALLEIPACINQNIAGVTPIPTLIESKFLWYWFQRQYEATRAKGNGSGPKALNCDRVRELEVLLPPMDEQRAIIERIETLFKVGKQIESRLAALKTHAQRLAPQVLAKAFRGELVEQDPQDEPASVLLQRLTASQPAKAAASRGRPRAPAKPQPSAADRQPTDWASLPDGAWAAPADADGHTTAVWLTAVLRAWGAPVHERTARLATLLCQQPLLFAPVLPMEQARLWSRLVGDAAAPLPAQVVRLQPASNHPWGRALQGMRMRGDLVEAGAGDDVTWALGPGAAAIDTAGWPDGRAGFVVAHLRAHGLASILPALAPAEQAFVAARAA